jgi:hypothetical protein
MLLLFHETIGDCKIIKYYIETCSLASLIVDVMARKGLNKITSHVIHRLCRDSTSIQFASAVNAQIVTY